MEEMKQSSYEWDDIDCFKNFPPALHCGITTKEFEEMNDPDLQWERFERKRWFKRKQRDKQILNNPNPYTSPTLAEVLQSIREEIKLKEQKEMNIEKNEIHYQVRKQFEEKKPKKEKRKEELYQTNSSSQNSVIQSQIQITEPFVLKEDCRCDEIDRFFQEIYSGNVYKERAEEEKESSSYEGISY